MKQKMIRLGIALLLVGAGWAVGRAQTATPDFEVVVDAPGGETSITCVRGCKLAWVERGVVSSSNASADFKFGCTRAERCSSYKVGGWIVK